MRSRDPNPGVLAGRLLFAVQLFAKLHPRHGSVLALLEKDGVRATELSRLSSTLTGAGAAAVAAVESCVPAELGPLLRRCAAGPDRDRVAGAPGGAAR